MKKLWKRSLAMLLAVLMVGCAVPISALAAGEDPALSGSCGKDGSNVTWAFDPNAGILTISGTGEMADYLLSSDLPWNAYLDSVQTVSIGSGITSIGNKAFRECSSLTHITIPNSVTSIGDEAFYNCISLANATVPNSVTSIGNYTFAGCKSLANFTIPDGVTRIGFGTFIACQSLTSITIPIGVTIIGSNAFSLCSNLTSVTIPYSVALIESGAFSSCDALQRVNYIGTRLQWKRIAIFNENEPLLRAARSYKWWQAIRSIFARLFEAFLMDVHEIF